MNLGDGAFQLEHDYDDFKQRIWMTIELDETWIQSWYGNGENYPLGIANAYQNLDRRRALFKKVTEQVLLRFHEWQDENPADIGDVVTGLTGGELVITRYDYEMDPDHDISYIGFQDRSLPKQVTFKNDDWRKKKKLFKTYLDKHDYLQRQRGHVLPFLLPDDFK